MSSVRSWLLHEWTISCREVISSIESDILYAFSGWLLGSDEIDFARFESIASATAQKVGAERVYRDPAVLGYYISTVNSNKKLIKSCIDQLDWLVGRPPERIAVNLGNDGLALLGLTLAAGITESIPTQQWLTDVLLASQTYRRDSISTVCCSTAAHLLGEPTLCLIPGDLEHSPYRIALHSKINSIPIQDGDENGLLNLILTTALSDYYAPIYLASMKWVTANCSTFSSSVTTKFDVVRILNGISHGFERWTWETSPRTAKKGYEIQKWKVENEFHFQNLLWFLIAPIFPNATYEEYTAQVGNLQPRLDIGLPDLHLILEVKFWRTNNSKTDLIRQIAEDASLYRVENRKDDEIIVIVWDEGRRTQDYTTLIQGVKKLAGLLDCILIPKPSIMVD